MPQPPMLPLPEGWQPTPERMSALTTEFGHRVDLHVSLRRFRLHYSEGQTARRWDAKFELWVLGDYQRAGAEEGTDSMGIPYNQRKTSRVQPAKPGDPDYVDFDDPV